MLSLCLCHLWAALSLYEQDTVISEWEDFLEGIASSPRPSTVERHDLAVDASDFPRHPHWCSRPEGLDANASAAQADRRCANSLQSLEGHGSSGGGGGGGGGGGSRGGQIDTCSTHPLQNVSDADDCPSQRVGDRPQHAPGASARSESIESVLDGSGNAIIVGGEDDALEVPEVADKPVPMDDDAEETGFGSACYAGVETRPKDGSEESHGISTPFASIDRSSVVRRSGDAEVADDDDSVEPKPELLYAIEFAAASVREGDKTIRLLAEVKG